MLIMTLDDMNKIYINFINTSTKKDQEVLFRHSLIYQSSYHFFWPLDLRDVLLSEVIQLNFAIITLQFMSWSCKGFLPYKF